MILWGKNLLRNEIKEEEKNASLLYSDLNLTNQNDDYMHQTKSVCCVFSHTFSLEFHFQAQKNIFVIGEKYFENFSFLIFLLAVDRCCKITQIQIKSLEILSLHCFNSIHFLLKKFLLSKSVKFSFFASPSFSSSVRVTLFTQHKQVLMLIFILSFF